MTTQQPRDLAASAVRPVPQLRQPRHGMSKTRSAREDALLLALARAPLISATDLSTVVGQGTGANNPGPALRALQAAGLVEYVTPCSALVTSQRLYYLTGWGVHQAALNRGEKPAAFAQRWSLGERALLRRLTRLEHLLLTRGLLLDLQRGLEKEGAEGGVSLVRWRPWPVRWTFDAGRNRWRTLRLDGVGALSRIGAEGEAAFALLWDHADADVDALRPRLRAALEARGLGESLGAGPALPHRAACIHKPCPRRRGSSHSRGAGR